MIGPLTNFDGYVVDAAQYAKWNRSVFEEMRDGGVTCVNATIVYWESARETLSEIGKWNRPVSYTHLTLPTTGVV